MMCSWILVALPARARFAFEDGKVQASDQAKYDGPLLQANLKED
jgi:hypothetical protein